LQERKKDKKSESVYVAPPPNLHENLTRW